MAELTPDEKKLLHAFVDHELKEIEKHEKDFTALMANSPALSQLFLQSKDIPFLATQEHYHKFLKNLLEKLK